MPEGLYPRPNDVNAPLRSTIGIGPRGPKGHSITAEVVDTDPYGYFRVQFKDAETGEVFVTTPNLDVGSRIFVTSDRMIMKNTTIGVTHSMPSSAITPLQASSDRNAVRVGDLIVFNAQLSADKTLLSVNTFGIGVVSRVDNQKGDGTFVEYDVVHFVVTNLFTARLLDDMINIPAIKFADPVEWSSTSNYDSLTIVMYEDNSYMSRQFVPAGTSINNEDYWVLIGNYSAQVERYRQEVIQKTFYFPTVAEMQESSYLTNGCVCITAGFHVVNDGGGSTYYISNNGTANGMNVITCQNGLSATLIAHDKINVLQLGATEHGSESILQYALDNYHEIVFEGTFYVEQPLQLRHRVQLTGINASLWTSSDIAIIEIDPNLDNAQQWALRDTYIANINFNGIGTQEYGQNAIGYGMKIGNPEVNELINAPYFVIENCNFFHLHTGLYLEGYAHMIQSCEARNCKYGYYFIHPEQSCVLDTWSNYCDVGLITNPIKEKYGHTFRIEGGAFQRCNVGIHILNLQDVYISTYHELNQKADVICGDPIDSGNYTKGVKNININSKSSSNSSIVGLIQLHATVYANINYVNYTVIDIPLVLATGYCKYIEVNLCSELIRTTVNACDFQGNSKGTSFCNVDHAMKVSPGQIPFENVSNSNQVEIRQSRVSRARSTDVIQDIILNDAGYKITLPRSQHGFYEIADSENQSYLLFQSHTLGNYRYGLIQVPMRFTIDDTVYQLSRDEDGFAKLDAV